MSNVDHPAHYGGADNPYETIKVLEDWLTPSEFFGFLRGNALKYQSRALSKGGVEDFEKAAWYQSRLISFAKEQGLRNIFPAPIFWNDAGETFDEADEVVFAAGVNLVVAVHSSVEPHTQWGLQPHYEDETMVDFYATKAEADAWLADFLKRADEQQEAEDVA